jgi:hypothetical protein
MLAYTHSQNNPSQRTLSGLSGTVEDRDTNAVRMIDASAARTDICAADHWLIVNLAGVIAREVVWGLVVPRRPPAAGPALRLALRQPAASEPLAQGIRRDGGLAMSEPFGSPKAS